MTTFHLDNNSTSDLSKPTRFVRLPEVLSRVGLCRASIYQYITKGTFPEPVRLGPRARGWRENEIEAWITARTQERDASPTASKNS